MIKQLWSLQNIQFGPTARPRLKLDDLSIFSGVTAVIGQSGAGKTSLLNLLVGFEKTTRGTIAFLSESGKLQQRISWVPPDFGLWPHLNVQQHLQAVASSQELLVGQLIEEFHLQRIIHQKPGSLSMGERSRLAIARSLAIRADVHLMDEPFAHVDPGRVTDYWRCLRTHLQMSNSSLVFSSHSPEVVLREAGQLICLDEGKLVWTGAPLDLYHNPPSRELGLLVGPLNWIDGTSSLPWRETLLPDRRSTRPEQVAIEESAESSWVVQQSRCIGSHGETEIKNSRSHQRQTIYHRLENRLLPHGTRVALRVVAGCLLMIACCIVQGCRESSGNEPQISFASLDQYLLPAEGAMLPAARGLAYSPAGELLVLDNIGRVLKYRDHKLVRKWWMPDYKIGRPERICVLHDGRLAIADTHYNRVVIFDQASQVADIFGECGSGPGQFIYTSAIAEDDLGFIYVAEYGGNDRIQKFTANGEFVLMFGGVGAEDGEFQRPSGLVWHAGVLYVADAINNRVQAFSSEGKFLRVVADAHSTGFYYPYDLCLGPDHTLFVVEYGAGRITQISLEGELIGRYGKEGRGAEELWTPWGIAVSPDGQITVADTGNRRIVEIIRK